MAPRYVRARWGSAPVLCLLVAAAASLGCRSEPLCCPTDALFCVGTKAPCPDEASTVTESHAAAPAATPATPDVPAPPAQSEPAEGGLEFPGGRPLTLPPPPPMPVREEPRCGERGGACCAAPALLCAPGLLCADGACVACASLRALELVPGHDSNAVRAISGDGRFAVGRSSGEGVPDRAVVWDLEHGGVTALDPLTGGRRAIAHAISPDGRWIVGQGDASDQSTGALLWAGAGTPEWLSTGEAYAVSADGSVVTGTTQSAGGLGFRWTRAAGAQQLPALDGLVAARGYATSADGAFIAGEVYLPGNLQYRAVRWDREGGLVDLGVLPGGNDSVASAISSDGSVVYGLSQSERGSFAYRWLASTGMQPLFPVRDTSESLPASNASGSVVVGRSYRRAVLWDAASGRSQLLTELLDDLVPADTELFEATGVSDDGRIVVGTGQSTERGLGMGWVASLGPRCSGPPEPAPPSAADAGAAPLEPPAEGARCASFLGLGVASGHVESFASGVSGDGSVAFGWGRASAGGPTQALRWKLGDVPEVELLSSASRSRVFGSNFDGSLISGFVATTDVQNDAFLWSASAGLSELLTNAQATDMSADGQTVVGTRPLANGSREAFRWTRDGGAVGLNDPYGLVFSQAIGISADGRVVVGSAANLVDDEGVTQAVAWTAAGLIRLAAQPGRGSLATAASADGQVIVGVTETDGLPQLFRWTADEGLTLLGVADMDGFPQATNATGSIVAGTSRARAFLWEGGRGQALSRRLGDLVPPGWVLLGVNDMSLDGTVLVGRGRSPERQVEAWMAVLGPHCSATEP